MQMCIRNAYSHTLYARYITSSFIGETNLDWYNLLIVYFPAKIEWSFIICGIAAQ